MGPFGAVGDRAGIHDVAKQAEVDEVEMQGGLQTSPMAKAT